MPLWYRVGPDRLPSGLRVPRHSGRETTMAGRVLLFGPERQIRHTDRRGDGFARRSADHLAYRSYRANAGRPRGHGVLWRGRWPTEEPCAIV